MLQLAPWDHRAIELAKAKRVLKWQRDPEGMRLRILEAAKQEFASHGLAGARVDRIAANAGANKRMLYYHVGNKEDLYLAVLEGAYEQIRSEERGLDLEHLDPPDAIERLIDFTWNYFLRNPEFLALLNTENLAKARHLKRSTKVKSMHSPFIEMIRTVVTRGVESGDFRVAVDPVQLYISIAGLCFFYLSNSATLSRDLRPRPPEEGCKGRAPRPHGGAGARGADGEIDRGFRQGRDGGRAVAGRTAGLEPSFLRTQEPIRRGPADERQSVGWVEPTGRANARPMTGSAMPMATRTGIDGYRFAPPILRQTRHHIPAAYCCA